MARFLVDEDLPRSLAPFLTAAGLSADDVRNRELRGQPDDEVFRHAVAQGFAVLSGDLGFGNIVRFPLGTHHGIVVARLPNDWPVGALNKAILAGLRGLTDEEITGNLVVIEPGRVRLRRRR
jgi:predicted nuclease of predicted toxin-antitoxin system